jgi:hypothetical protein
MTLIERGCYDWAVPSTQPMRHRSEEHTPNQEKMNEILGGDASPGDQERFFELLRRLRRACFLDKDNHPLSPPERLISLYKQDGLVLFLGAGVSRDSGIPSWAKLADNVLLKCVLKKAKAENGELENLKKAFPSYEVQFELARRNTTTQKEFVEAIYDALYPARMSSRKLLEKIPIPLKEQKEWPE